MSESASAGETRERETDPAQYRPPSIWRLIQAHKRGTGVALAIVVAILAVAVISGLGSRVTRVADASPCSLWSSASQAERDAYAALYVKEHGPLPSGASDAGTIEGVIDDGCTQAYGFDEADTVTVLQAIRHQY